ncbi:putative kinetochore protein NDC80 [Scheffersomyces xylosifermentans]|uniref:putative kinetochore protein NDC80 n=1 Tax=Scheffersomyces xylosifermentans TaxID=1304137 RepID=UPI00315C9B93
MSNPPSSLIRKSTGKSLTMGSAARSSFHIARLPLDAKSLSNTINSTNGASNVAVAKRLSLLSTPASTNKRRQSQSSQQLHPPSSSQHSSQQTPQNSQQTYTSNAISLQKQQQVQQQHTPSQQLLHSGSNAVDQRPLRDKQYQALIQSEIYDFLVANKFELETNHAITQKSLQQPTQKDFTSIFRFLYNKIDPYYQFHGSVEKEVHTLLKNLNYPYIDGINRSQIGAVGAQNWPSFLGVLYWLVKLNLAIVNLDVDDSLISPGDEFDRIFIKYIRDSYNAFINERDDYSEFYNEMRLQFEQLNAALIEDIRSLEEENTRLQSQFNEINGQLIELQQAEKKSRALDDDLRKFRAYIDEMESKKVKWAEILKKCSTEINNYEKEIQALNDVKREYEEKIESQGITVNDINNLNIERDQLSKAIDQISKKMENARSSVESRQIDLIKNYQSLENFINSYNNTIQKVKSADYNFEIKLNEDILRSATDPNTSIVPAFEPDAIINKILRDEKVSLLQYRSEIKNNVHKYKDDNIKLSEQYDQLMEKIQEQQEYFEDLQNRYNRSRDNYHESYDAMMSDSLACSAQIEQLNRDLKAIQVNANEGVIGLETELVNINFKESEVDHQISRSRKELYEKCAKMSQFIANFKVRIQSNLLDLDDLTNSELENEKDKELTTGELGEVES